MTFFLPETTEDERAQATDTLAVTKPSFGEQVSAATDSTRIRKDLNHRATKIEEELAAEIREMLPPQFVEADERDFRDVPAEARHDMLFEGVRRAKEFNPKYGSLPDNIEDFDAELRKRRMAELQDAEDVLAAGDSWSAQMIGDIWAEVSTPEGAASVLAGAPGRLRIVPTMLLEGAAASLFELYTVPDQYDVAEDLGLDAPKPGRQAVVAGLTGAGVAGALVGAGRAVSYSMARSRTTGARRPEGAGQVQFSQDVRRAQEDLEMGTPVSRSDGQGAAGGEAGTLPDVLGGAPLPRHVKRQPAPSNWPAIRNGIFAGESGGDYDALYEFQNRPGGRFADVKISEMTVDEAIAFSRGSGEYGSWVKGQIGRVATPMGAYQIVGTTLRAAKKGLGLRGDEKMSPALQDQLGLWIYNRQGTGAWVGYKGPRATRPTPGEGSAPAYTTRRGYTSTGQVAVGDDMRIDVEYEVIDLDSLRQATGDLQPRDRGRAASDAWVADTAARLDPAQLMPSPTADRGAPIVGPDNVIESGNGRVRAVERAYEQHPDRIDQYRRQIEAATGKSVPEGVERPVLVARRKSELDAPARRRMVVEAQDSGVARMTATERAQTGQRALSAEMLARYRPGQKLTSAANRDFARAFSGAFPRSERNAFINAEGGLSIDGVRQIQDSLFARAWDAPDILARHVEAEPGQLRSLLDGLAEAAPEVASLRAAIEAGDVRPEMDITPFIMDAARLIMAARDLARREGGDVGALLEELLGDIDILEGATPPLTQALVRHFAPGGKQIPAADFAAFLKRYAGEAMKAGRAGDALLEQPGPVDVLRSIDKEAFGHLEETGVARDVAAARPSEPHEPEAAPMIEDAFEDGASSAAAEQGDDLAAAQLREDFGDLEIELEDGTRWAAREILDDLDADEALETAIDLCMSRGAA